MFLKLTAILLLFFLLSTACQPSPTPTPTLPPTATNTPAPTSIPTRTAPVVLNPLTSLPVTDPKLLKTPAVLISISHFPALSRPQAGLSFAPFVYEISITEGASRFLTVFYGEPILPEAPPIGGCEPRSGALTQTDVLLGGLAWLDIDADGLLGIQERGMGGVCVNLYDGGGILVQQTSTDTNGYYGFNVQPGHYSVEFLAPEWTRFSAQTNGAGGRVSAADPLTGRVERDVAADVLNLDAGLIPLNDSVLHPDASLLPLPQVGPIRSGRLIYRYLADSFQNSCLIFASASGEVLPKLPQCLTVFHQFSGGGYMLDIGEMAEVAKQNRREQGNDFDYSGYVFSTTPPPGGAPAAQLNVFYAYLNQSGWIYDPLYQAYLRFVDTSAKLDAGRLFPDHDRLTGRQLHFENVIVLYARHDVVSPTNLDIHLNPGREGDALLFRDGRMYEIEWRMPGAVDREDSYMLTFLDTNGDPALLKPGHTWVVVVSDYSNILEVGAGKWRITYVPPEGEAR